MLALILSSAGIIDDSQLCRQTIRNTETRKIEPKSKPCTDFQIPKVHEKNECNATLRTFRSKKKTKTDIFEDFGIFEYFQNTRRYILGIQNKNGLIKNAKCK